MASIPCAAYQASHIHAHLRRQNMRKRHTSNCSTDSTASDPNLIGITPQLLTEQTMPSTPPTGEYPVRTTPLLIGTSQLLTEQTMPSTPPTVTLRDRMEQVSHWVGDSFKKFRYPLASVSSDVMTSPATNTEKKTALAACAVSVSESAMPLPSATTKAGIIAEANT